MNAAVDIPSSETVTKGEFARICNVLPGRVSQWISEGKLSKVAMHGTGRRAKIRVEVALADLNRNLDIDQRFGNGITTRLHVPGLAKSRSGLIAGEADQAPAQTVDGTSVESQIKHQRLIQLEADNRRRLEEEYLRQGRYVLSDVARAEEESFSDAVGSTSVDQRSNQRFGTPGNQC